MDSNENQFCLSQTSQYAQVNAKLLQCIARPF